MSDLITDAMVEAAAQAFANHEYRINGPEMVPYCTCGQVATFRYDVDWYDQHMARLTLEVVAPLIAAKVLWDAAEAFGENQTIREGDVKEWLRARADRMEKP